LVVFIEAFGTEVEETGHLAALVVPADEADVAFVAYLGVRVVD